MSSQPSHTTDGRRARRDQNRERVVDAMLALYRQGELQPSVAEVAARSGVSHRSVFRYFEDLDELYRVAIERQWAAVADLWELPDLGEGSLDRRIDRLVEQRLALYDVAAPVARVGHMRAPTQPFLLDHLRRTGRQANQQISAHFEPELAALDEATREAVAEAATVAVSMETMEALCFLRELDRTAAGAVMRTTLKALFDR